MKINNLNLLQIPLVVNNQIVTTETFYDSIGAMCDFIIQKDIKRVNMYTIGAGRSQMPWMDTEKVLRSLLSKTNVNIVVYM